MVSNRLRPGMVSVITPTSRRARLACHARTSKSVARSTVRSWPELCHTPGNAQAMPCNVIADLRGHQRTKAKAEGPGLAVLDKRGTEFTSVLYFLPMQ
jgi:hypothetical protein